MITSPDLDDLTLNQSLNFVTNPVNGQPGVVKTLIFDAVSCGAVNLLGNTFPSLQDFECPNLTDAGAITSGAPVTVVITGNTNLTTINFASLVTYHTPQIFNVSLNPALTSFSAPVWQGFHQSFFPPLGLLDMHGNTALTAVSLPAFQKFSIGCTFAGCTNLASIDIAFDTVTYLFSINQTYTLNFTNCALPTDEVNRLLILIAANAYVTHGNGNTWKVNFSGGTNGAPSGDGLVAKQTLFNRGVQIITN